MEARRALTLVAVVLPSFTYGLYRFSVGVLVPTMESVYSINDATAGLVISASVGLVGIGVIGSGYLAQRLGDVKVILAGFLLFALPMGAVVLGGGLVVFSALFLLASFGSGLMITPSYGVAAELFPKRKGFTAAFVTSGYSFSGFFGPSITGYLLETYGWSGPFAGFAFEGLLIFFFVLGVLGLGKRSSTVSALGTFSRLLRTRVILIISAAAFFADFGFLVYLSWAPKFLATSFAASGVNATAVDTLFGVGLGLGAFGTLTGGALFDRIGGRKSATIAGLLPATVLTGVYLSNSFLVAAGFVVLTGLFGNMFWSLITVMCQVNAKAEERTAATSVVQTSGFLGAFLGPGVAGVLGGPVPPVLIVTSTIPYAILASIAAFLYRDPKQPAPSRT